MFIKGASVWTDVTPEIIMLFFLDLLVLVKQALWVESQPFPASVSLWTTLSNTFHCTTIADGSVWGPAMPIHDSPDRAIQPFVQTRLPNTSMPCILPRIIDVNGLTTFTYYDVSHEIRFLENHATRLTAQGQWALLLAPTNCALQQTQLPLEKTHCACRTAVNLNIKKMCTFSPKYFVKDKLCTWWWIGDVRNTVHGVDGMAFFQAFVPLIKRHGGTLVVPPLAGLALRARPRTYATYFRKICTIESTIRSKAVQQSWNPKLRRIKTSFD